MSPNEADFMGKALLSIIAGFARGALFAVCAAGMIWSLYSLVKLCKRRKG